MEKSAKEQNKFDVSSIGDFGNWCPKMDLHPVIFQQRREALKFVPLNTDIIVVRETGESSPRIEFDVNKDRTLIICRYNTALPHWAKIPPSKIFWPIDEKFSKGLEGLKSKKLEELVKQEALLRDSGNVDGADFAKKLQEIVKGIDWCWENTEWKGVDDGMPRFASINARCANVKLKESDDHEFFGHFLTAMQAVLEEIGGVIGFEPEGGVDVLKVTEDTEHLFREMMRHDVRSNLWIEAHKKI